MLTYDICMEKIHETFNVTDYVSYLQVTQADEKPKQLCYHCLSKLELCYELVECSLASDYKFDSIIHSQNGDFMCTEATQKLMMPVLQVWPLNEVFNLELKFGIFCRTKRIRLTQCKLCQLLLK